MNSMGILVLSALVFMPTVPVAGQQGESTVKVVPEKTDELLANPGMGWETFHYTSRQDKNLPSWIPSTIHYARWGWGQLEPEPGNISYAFLDKILKETHDSCQRLAFRVMCCSPSQGHPYHPNWLKTAGGRELAADYNGGGPILIPDMDDPVVLERHLDFIKRLGDRYDGHPDLDRLDLGSVGWWGEWHLSGSKTCQLPTLENRMKIINAYLVAFKKTPLLMLIGGKECLTYATQHGAGWRADSLGDLGSFSPTWNHMLNAYPHLIKEAKVQEAWKNGPVAFEPPAEVREFVDKRWPLRWIFNYGLALHGSSFSGKSGRLPDDETFRKELERFLRRLGYRLVLRELEHPAQARPGEKLELEMQWQNVGSAPCYKPYRVAYRLANGSGYQKIFISDTAVNRWLPGSIELFTEDFFKQPKDLPPGEIAIVRDSIALPQDIPAGAYRFSVAVVDGKPAKPLVKLAIKGRADDGWYPLSKLDVVK